ncbi:MAG: hypothetical protein AVDCRST_MAG47-563, partial [uncultured Nocardioidaceae bacterium]
GRPRLGADRPRALPLGGHRPDL